MVPTNSVHTKQYKDNLLLHFGGEMDYEMTIIDYNERIISDNELRRHFEALSASRFNRFLCELLDLAFLDQTKNEDGDLRDRKLWLYRLISECALNECNFDRMKMHFIESLRHSWVNGDVIAIASSHLEDLRYLFAHHSIVVSPPKSAAGDHAPHPSTTTRSVIHSLAGISSKAIGQQYRLQK